MDEGDDETSASSASSYSTTSGSPQEGESSNDLLDRATSCSAQLPWEAASATQTTPNTVSSEDPKNSLSDLTASSTSARPSFDGLEEVSVDFHPFSITTKEVSKNVAVGLITPNNRNENREGVVALEGEIKYKDIAVHWAQITVKPLWGDAPSTGVALGVGVGSAGNIKAGGEIIVEAFGLIQPSTRDISVGILVGVDVAGSYGGVGIAPTASEGFWKLWVEAQSRKPF